MAATLPHVAYAEAVHAALTAAGLTRSTLEVRSTYDRELTLACTWPASAPVLNRAQWARGMRLWWSSARGWTVDDPATGDARILLLDALASPDAITEAAILLATQGLDADLPRVGTRWSHAQALDIALSHWEDGAAPC
ncbi:hypothetical protein AQ490_23345 [Wenjunlia vitaminophila]|uniref:Uncharacterized protein n=1 Tax=Wenjunlia vitaminophila TaxID=76728 RepID=A0A0T6LRY9_WENVI|nr:hypothetical protein [Wenjunlia vitaminophila]KRV48806.1 hypothetical protein AQ490_23345 [Wenjunlia vitaminophila]